eukprot:191871_1
MITSGKMPFVSMFRSNNKGIKRLKDSEVEQLQKGQTTPSALYRGYYFDLSEAEFDAKELLKTQKKKQNKQTPIAKQRQKSISSDVLFPPDISNSHINQNKENIVPNTQLSNDAQSSTNTSSQGSNTPSFASSNVPSNIPIPRNYYYPPSNIPIPQFPISLPNITIDVSQQIDTNSPSEYDVSQQIDTNSPSEYSVPSKFNLPHEQQQQQHQIIPQYEAFQLQQQQSIIPQEQDQLYSHSGLPIVNFQYIRLYEEAHRVVMIYLNKPHWLKIDSSRTDSNNIIISYSQHAQKAPEEYETEAQAYVQKAFPGIGNLRMTQVFRSTRNNPCMQQTIPIPHIQLKLSNNPHWIQHEKESNIVVGIFATAASCQNANKIGFTSKDSRVMETSKTKHITIEIDSDSSDSEDSESSDSASNSDSEESESSDTASNTCSDSEDSDIEDIKKKEIKQLNLMWTMTQTNVQIKLKLLQSDTIFKKNGLMAENGEFIDRKDVLQTTDELRDFLEEANNELKGMTKYNYKITYSAKKHIMNRMMFAWFENGEWEICILRGIRRQKKVTQFKVVGMGWAQWFDMQRLLSDCILCYDI